MKMKLSRYRHAVVAVAAITPLLAGCVHDEADDTASGSSEPTPIVSSVTADYGNYGVRERGTNWGMLDDYHTACRGACRTAAGGS
jgi:hypothetical protein